LFLVVRHACARERSPLCAPHATRTPQSRVACLACLAALLARVLDPRPAGSRRPLQPPLRALGARLFPARQPPVVALCAVSVGPARRLAAAPRPPASSRKLHCAAVAGGPQPPLSTPPSLFLCFHCSFLITSSVMFHSLYSPVDCRLLFSCFTLSTHFFSHSLIVSLSRIIFSKISSLS
jgi:hypothetical protein